jgi:flagella basal body P-ring formation protein FlgA
MRNYLYRLLKSLFIIKIMVLLMINSIIAKPVVVLRFVDSATVNDTTIYLRNIAAISTDSPEIKQQLSSAIVGDIAPPGYSRFINTADLLLYRLRPVYKDIDIKVADNKRIVVRTVGIVRKIGDYTNVVGNYLREHIDWKEGEWSFVIENSEESWKSLDFPMVVSIERSSAAKMATPYPRGHLQLQFVVNQRERITRIPIVCLIKISAPVVVSKHALNNGKVIDSNDIELKKADISCFGSDPYYKIEDLLGKKTMQNINQGSILFNKLIAPVPIVSKGDQLAIKVTQGNVRISVLAIARENGNLGQKIWVENATTHKLVKVIIKDKNSGVVL